MTQESRSIEPVQALPELLNPEAGFIVGAVYPAPKNVVRLPQQETRSSAFVTEAEFLIRGEARNLYTTARQDPVANEGVITVTDEREQSSRLAWNVRIIESGIEELPAGLKSLADILVGDDSDDSLVVSVLAGKNGDLQVALVPGSLIDVATSPFSRSESSHDEVMANMYRKIAHQGPAVLSERGSTRLEPGSISFKGSLAQSEKVGLVIEGDTIATHRYGNLAQPGYEAAILGGDGIISSRSASSPNRKALARLLSNPFTSQQLIGSVIKGAHEVLTPTDVVDHEPVNWSELVSQAEARLKAAETAFSQIITPEKPSFVLELDASQAGLPQLASVLLHDIGVTGEEDKTNAFIELSGSSGNQNITIRPKNIAPGAGAVAIGHRAGSGSIPGSDWRITTLDQGPMSSYFTLPKEYELTVSNSSRNLFYESLFAELVAVAAYAHGQFVELPAQSEARKLPGVDLAIEEGEG